MKIANLEGGFEISSIILSDLKGFGGGKSEFELKFSSFFFFLLSLPP
jgi:hypothetical protein